MSELAPENNNAPVEETPAVETPAAPEGAEQWVGPTQEEWQQAQQFQAAATPILQQIANNMGLGQQQQQQAAPTAPELDPFDPNSVKAYIDHGIKEGTKNYEGMLRLVEAQQGEALARQELDRLHAEVGEFDDDTALMIAAGLLDQGVQPNQALGQAGQMLRTHEEKIRAAERERHGIALQTHNEAPREAAASTGIAQEESRVPVGKDRYESAVNNFLASRKAGLPMG